VRPCDRFGVAPWPSHSPCRRIICARGHCHADGALVEKRAEYRRDFVDSVAPVGVRGDPDVVAACCKSVAAAQRQLWKLRWDNHYKEVYWRLVVNGLATTERMHMQNCGCVCGPVVGGPPGRHHHFWECFVAQAVVAQLQHKITG
jgi:hypothetical protein